MDSRRSCWRKGNVAQLNDRAWISEHEERQARINRDELDALTIYPSVFSIIKKTIENDRKDI
jgi:hypothetical protein